MKILQTDSLDYYAGVAARAMSSLKQVSISAADLSAQIKVIDGKLGWLEADVVDAGGAITKDGTYRRFYNEKPYYPKYTSDYSVPKTFGWQPASTKSADTGEAQPVFEMGDLLHTTLEGPPDGVTDAPIPGNQYVEFDVRHGVTNFNRVFVGYFQQEGRAGNDSSVCGTYFLGGRWRQGFGTNSQEPFIVCTGYTKPYVNNNTHGFLFHGFEFTLRS